MLTNEEQHKILQATEYRINQLRTQIAVKENDIGKLESEIDDLKYELKEVTRKEMAMEIINFIEGLKVPEDGRHEWRDRHNETIERIIPKLNQKFIKGVEVEE